MAVIGASADDIRAQYGDWTYFTHPKLIPNRPAVRPYVTIREGIEVIGAQENFEVVYHRGCGVLPSDADNIPGAVAACRNADAIVLVVGDVYAQYGETKDRADLALSGRQLELYRELRALGIPLVTVLLSSSRWRFRKLPIRRMRSCVPSTAACSAVRRSRKRFSGG